MRLEPHDSWRISVGGGSGQHMWPLWIRAAERIHVPAGGVIPGPLDITPLPAPSLASGAPLVESWLGWWRAVLDIPRSMPGGDLSRYLEFEPPDFEGLAAWPALREVVLRRWSEARAWQSGRIRADPLTPPHEGVDLARFVSGIERSLGRRSPTFEMEFILLPVRDDKVRPIDGIRFLVPERLYGTPAWYDWLRPVVTRLAAGG